MDCSEHVASAGANAGANACHGHEANAAMEQASAPYPWQGQAHAGMSSMPNAVHVILSSMDMPSISSMPIASFSSHAHSQLQLPCPTQLTEILGLLGPLGPLVIQSHSKPTDQLRNPCLAEALLFE